MIKVSSGIIFSLIPLFGLFIFLIVIGMFIVFAVRGISRWGKNNASPVLTVDAAVVAKRTHMSRGTGNMHGHTSYYATFEVESGDRMELRVDGQEYGMLVEGDQGRLTFQGTRYQGFQRTNAHFH